MAGDLVTDPREAFRRGQITDLSAGERAALDGGADFAQVVNARRGTSGLGGLTTTEGTSRRGFASSRLQGRQRLTPDGILAQAGDDRDRALQLLQDNGYVVLR
jgi:hypothetical protein